MALTDKSIHRVQQGSLLLQYTAYFFPSKKKKKKKQQQQQYYILYTDKANKLAAASRDVTARQNQTGPRLRFT
jgi:hypothetical protein